MFLCAFLFRARRHARLLMLLCLGSCLFLILTNNTLTTGRERSVSQHGSMQLILPSASPASSASKWLSAFNCPLSPEHNHNGLNSLLELGDIVTPKWTSEKRPKSPFFLVEVLQVRIYSTDKARWTVKELKQWIHYMFWAGVQHIYLCDHYKFEHEKLIESLQKYIYLGLLTYIPWNMTDTAMRDQVLCYHHVHYKYRHLTKWMISVDMDEYPFVTDDFKEGFLSRYLAKLDPEVKVVLLHNFLMLGVGDRTRDMVTERLNRITVNRANKLDKPIFQPAFAISYIHEAFLTSPGKVEHGLEEKIRLIHYWGGRLQNWGPDTDYIRNQTVEFNDLRDFVSPFVRISLLVLGECDAFDSSSGP